MGQNRLQARMHVLNKTSGSELAKYVQKVVESPS